MALDGTVLGNCASEQMEALDEAFGEDPDIEVGAVMTIVEIRKVQSRDADGDPASVASIVRMRHNVGDPFHAVGVLEQAKHDLLTGE